MPELAGRRPFLLLLRLVGAEQRDELGRQAEHASTCFGLDPARGGPGGLALRAASGLWRD